MDDRLKPTCRLVRVADTYDGKQGLRYFCGIAAETAGFKVICTHLLTIRRAEGRKRICTRTTKQRSTSLRVKRSLSTALDFSTAP